MFLEIVRSEGLGHLSYIFGDGGRAAVVDPRRDCDVYVDVAYREGAQITHIFETHRNEDYVIGSLELASRTDARIFHGGALPFDYGEDARDGDTFELGDIHITILETPGHTMESISLVLADTGFSGEPIAVFTGDALFIGDVGRTDFFPDRAKAVAGLLYDSIFEKLLPLGDHVIVYPAHGAGSVCGSGMASREFSTLGYERRYNPVLQLTDRDAFIRRKTGEHHYQPPYFKKMEVFNLEGAPLIGNLPKPRPLSSDAFADRMAKGSIALDIRSPEAIAGAHIPGSLAIPCEMLPSFAGWYVSHDNSVALVASRYEDVEAAVRHLARLGYDNVVGFLDEGLHGWEVSGRDYETIPALHAKNLKERIESSQSFVLLDVRARDEIEAARLSDCTSIYVGELPDRLDEIPSNRPITTFCGSGQRAIIAASILRGHGFEDVEVCLGSMAACRAIGCPIETG
jgi:hydroxyacylglutathione hydrolase